MSTNASSDTGTPSSSSTATRCAESWMTSDILTTAVERVFSSTSTTNPLGSRYALSTLATMGQWLVYLNFDSTQSSSASRRTAGRWRHSATRARRQRIHHETARATASTSTHSQIDSNVMADAWQTIAASRAPPTPGCTSSSTATADDPEERRRGEGRLDSRPPPGVGPEAAAAGPHP